jgi:hypothetical protein
MNILVCGAGAIGSNLIRSLVPDCAMFNNIGVLDHDLVEERNITAGTQWYTRDQIGVAKVEAIEFNVYKAFGHQIWTKNKLVTAADLREPNLVIDCFDNHDARMVTQRVYEDGLCQHVLHIGFSDKMTFAVEWAEDYRVPSDITTGIDVCEMPGASAFVSKVASLGSLAAQQFIAKRNKLSFIGGKFLHSSVS